jgi:hypothetical protein
MPEFGLRVLVSKKLATLLVIFLTVLTLSLSCNRQGSDHRLQILEKQSTMLMIVEAEQGFHELFKATFAPAKSQLLVGADLKAWLADKKKSLGLVPEPIRAAIESNQGIGLLIQGGLPDKKGGTHDVVYLRAPAFGIRSFFLRLDPDPCGDGNPATCENCSGCSGESSPGEIIKTCVCTEGCDVCRTCPTC